MVDWVGDGIERPLLPQVLNTLREIERGVGMDAPSFEQIIVQQQALILQAQRDAQDRLRGALRQHGPIVLEAQKAVQAMEGVADAARGPRIADIIETVDSELEYAFRTRNKRAVREISDDLQCLRDGP